MIADKNRFFAEQNWRRISGGVALLISSMMTKSNGCLRCLLYHANFPAKEVVTPSTLTIRVYIVSRS